MNTQSFIPTIALNQERMAQLTFIVNETLAFDHQPVKVKLFTAAQLWDIQKRRNTATTRRRYI
jgi:hypothetical protein